MINWSLSFFKDTTPKVGDWIIFVNDVDVDWSLCTTSLKYNQVVRILEIKFFQEMTIVDVGIKFKDPNTFSLDQKSGCYVPGQGIRWMDMKRFRVATPIEVDRWLSENDPEYKRDKKLDQILNK